MVLGDTSLAENGKAQDHDLNQAQINDEHMQSNDSIMNPKIMAAEPVGQHDAMNEQHNMDMRNME